MGRQPDLLPLPELRLGLSAGEAESPAGGPPARGGRMCCCLSRRARAVISAERIAAAHAAGDAPLQRGLAPKGLPLHEVPCGENMPRGRGVPASRTGWRRSTCCRLNACRAADTGVAWG